MTPEQAPGGRRNARLPPQAVPARRAPHLEGVPGATPAPGDGPTGPAAGPTGTTSGSFGTLCRNGSGCSMGTRDDPAEGGVV
ncbi:hypothetical protein GCM10019016_017880 [Streptomyces prasinosporus]|uniref:Uncharacterized protein n=1 Tax=Streptomyces prasinosporus TaxID=68256 RepID=A0ABP6THJ4_9ACTN